MKTIISMWSGPRNISTTLMRSFASRADVTALDEPFYGAYLARTGAPHPYREETLTAYPHAIDGVLDWIERSKIKGTLFLKHIAYHLPDDLDLSFLDSWRNFLLIRDPRAMVASFADRFEDVAPIVRSYETGLAIFERLAALNISCPIVDADDVLKAPEPMLRTLCASLGLPFDPAMLSWPSGQRPEDGPWAPHWYAAVRSTTGFSPFVEKKVTLSNDLEAIAERAAPFYRQLRARRLTA